MKFRTICGLSNDPNTRQIMPYFTSSETCEATAPLSSLTVQPTLSSCSSPVRTVRVNSPTPHYVVPHRTIFWITAIVLDNFVFPTPAETSDGPDINPSRREKCTHQFCCIHSPLRLVLHQQRTGETLCPLMHQLFLKTGPIPLRLMHQRTMQSNVARHTPSVASR